MKQQLIWLPPDLESELRDEPKVPERPLLLSPALVRKTLDDLKDETRRVMKPQPGPRTIVNVGDCPYGEPGDRLWVRERHILLTDRKTGEETVLYAADIPEAERDEYRYRPSIHMKRIHCRLELEIVKIWWELVQAITRVGAIREGIAPSRGWDEVRKYSILWDSINKSRGYPWASNPAVWVVRYKVVKIANTEKEGESQ